MRSFRGLNRVLPITIGLAMFLIGAPQLLPEISAAQCPALPPAEGLTVVVNTEGELRGQASNAPAGTTIIVASGIYNMSNYIHLANDGVTLRGETGDRADVILDFGGMTWVPRITL